jgi:hypothetical protein
MFQPLVEPVRLKNPPHGWFDKGLDPLQSQSLISKKEPYRMAGNAGVKSTAVRVDWHSTGDTTRIREESLKYLGVGRGGSMN